jgi:hypothetical protein
MNEELLIALLHCLLEAKPEGFRCEVFELNPFDDAADGVNFFYNLTGTSVEWYKYPGRGMGGDYQNMSAKEILQMGLKCFEAMGK